MHRHEKRNSLLRVHLHKQLLCGNFFILPDVIQIKRIQPQNNKVARANIPLFVSMQEHARGERNRKGEGEGERETVREYAFVQNKIQT